MINLLATMGFGPNSTPSSVILDGFVVNPVEPATFFGCAFTIDNDMGDLSADNMASMESELCQR